MTDASSDAAPETVVVDGESLTPEDVEAVARRGAKVEIDEEARAAVVASRERVAEIVESGQAVYGLNTGFGQLVDTRIEESEIEQLQTNLLRSHASGAGRALDTEEVRSLLLTRLNALVKGYSGVREIVVDHLATMLNERIHPVVRSRGSLGASGDLAPLAHLALVLIGEGEATVSGEHGERERLSGAEALATAELEPLTLAPKEGLALINGTQLTTGVAALLVVDAERLAEAADAAGALTTEVTMGTTANCDPAIHRVRPHGGQAAVAEHIQELTANSEIVESHANCDRVQDAYSVRCLPQVHGAVRDAIEHLREAVEIELNSATDNPLVFDAENADNRATGTDDAVVISGGNFHGEPLALRLDYLVSALTELAAISERRVDRMVNPNIQEDHLPPFLAEDSGLNSGFMIPQYTAASLINEIRATGRPSMDNTPVSGGQEDHVSMSATSAFSAKSVLENARTVVAVELLTGSQASEFVDDSLAHGRGTSVVYELVREVSPPVTEDRSLDADIEAVAELVATGLLEERLDDVM
ncbi:histidine ammonia-lyase [Halogeometricum borinquense DSM 11551]|uniref:Probable histidine ammonia-lyase n=1 Tax=Halogeometricum borinquense (strain ATCC 700274 / DSM 11551 / JCM 10706 / KCTC 4070 / PR3) TaxID=469382 RepID=E4NT40_HALBP|nr:histidine ammonia-lyase [Halogeometricum borinquense]ADQ67033.1 histidine ammonia-lyase [Halogeometricum borinquense DSM 11551]ELY29824.1 histidine ammonia-lyase [Halogeometricum borinquense DSM 11551]